MRCRPSFTPRAWQTSATAVWREESEWAIDATDVALIAELSSRDHYPGFRQFIDAMTAASLTGDIYDLTYVSPSQGPLSVGWEQPLTVNGLAIPVSQDRIHSPWCQARFGARETTISHQSQTLRLS